MNRLKYHIKKGTFCLFVLLCSGCDDRYDFPIPRNSFEETELPPPAKVTLSKSGGSWKMFIDGTTYFVKGVCANNYYGESADFGANTIRTYGVADDSQKILDDAFKAGLYVNF